MVQWLCQYTCLVVLEYWSNSIVDLGMRITELEISPLFELY